jgi:hypothetical protein
VNRAIPAACEVCGKVAPVCGVGFPLCPGAIPGLPEYLRGAALWVCAAPACDLAAQQRAARAAAQAGITLKTIWRHWRFDTPEPERTRQ